MQSSASSKASATNGRWAIALVFVCLLIILCALFHRAFEPNTVVFSNDGPLGVQMSEQMAMPQAFKGVWLDLSWIGAHAGVWPLNVSCGLGWLFGPVGFSKFYEPISLLLLGFCASVFFRSLGLNSGLCVVGAIAAALNSNFFSNACWGLGSRPLTLAFVFLALAALNARRVGNPWLNAALAGLAVGMGVVEGADNGIIFSLFVAAFLIFQSFVEERSLPGRFTKSLRLLLMTGFALFIATQSLVGLFGLAQKGAVSAKANPEEKERNWTFATQWSLPPAETLRVIIPGLYGYRMDGSEGRTEKAYWGRVGESPVNPEVYGRRFSGAGEYAGLLVVLLAFWTVAASFSRSLNIFSLKERKFIWFWSGAVVVSVLLSWGRFAPFYQFFYTLPYFSSIRNPMKFMHVAHMALMILFGYGLLGLSRRYLEKTATPLSWVAQLKSWWAKAAPFERRWTWVLILLTGISAVAYLGYNANRAGLEKHLMLVGFDNSDLAGKIARYSVFEVGAFVVWLAVSCAALLLVMGGVFSGKRSVWAAVLLGVVLTADLARANLPWIVYWNYPYKYATNPVIDILRQKPFEGRVVFPQQLMDGRMLSNVGGYNYLFPQLYGIDWVQQHFPYYNIQCLDIAQDPRPPADKEAFVSAVGGPYNYLAATGTRYWQLTNTRYILGMTGFLDALNVQLDKGRNRFRIVTTFTVDPKPGVQPVSTVDFTAVIATNGPLALFEFTGALPRTKLYSQWQVSTNNDVTLKTLIDPAFDPSSTLIVSDEIPPAPTSTNNAPGTAEIVSYKPQRVEIRASAGAPSVLLLNDRFDPDWRVSVDGQPASLLRCNFIMRGVQLSPGGHTVVFTFQPSLKGRNVSLIAIAIGVVLCGLLFFVRQPGAPAPSPVSSPSTAPSVKPARK